MFSIYFFEKTINKKVNKTIFLCGPHQKHFPTFHYIEKKFKSRQINKRKEKKNTFQNCWQT